MASLANNAAYRPATVEEFLAMDLGDAKAELVDGVIYLMAGGSARHAAIALNLGAALLQRLRGSGCRPYGSDLAVRTGQASVRFPDLSVHCRDPGVTVDPNSKLLGEPKIIFEVLSPSTASNDQIVKLAEYRALEGVDAVVFVDPDNERLRVVSREAADDVDWLPKGSELVLPTLGISIAHDEIFAID